MNLNNHGWADVVMKRAAHGKRAEEEQLLVITFLKRKHKAFYCNDLSIQLFNGLREVWLYILQILNIATDIPGCLNIDLFGLTKYLPIDRALGASTY